MKVLQLQIITSSPANRHLPSSFFFFFFLTTLKLCRPPQVLFCTAWWEVESGWKPQLTSQRREKKTRRKEWKAWMECDKSAPPFTPGKRRYKREVLKANGQKSWVYYVASFIQKVELRPHLLFPRTVACWQGTWRSCFRESTRNLLSFILVRTPIQILISKSSKTYISVYSM